MAGLNVDVEVKGMIELQNKIEQVVSDMYGPPVLQAMRDSTLLVEADAKKGLVGYQGPEVGGVNTGRLRASITPEVRKLGSVVEGVVGSNVQYAPFVEYDCVPHWPPIAALEDWAHKHGTSAYLVAKGISIAGTKGKKFFDKAFNKNRASIKEIFNRALGGIVNKR